MKSYGRAYKALLHAIRFDQIDGVQRALVACVDPRGNRSLVISEAIRLGRIHHLNLFVQRGIDLTGLQSSPLALAAVWNLLDVLRFLIDLGIFPPEELDAAICDAFDAGRAASVSMLLEAGGKLPQPVDFCICNNADSVDCFCLLMQLGHDPRPHAANIISDAVTHRSHTILRFVLQHFPVHPQLLNNLLSQAALQSSVRVLKMLISAGATCPTKCTEAFNLAPSYRRTRSAKLLLRYLDTTQVTAGAFVGLAYCSQWKLIRKLLNRGPLPSGLHLSSFAAAEIVQRFRPEEFFPKNPTFELSPGFHRD